MTDAELLKLKAEMLVKKINTNDLARRFRKTRRSINYALAGKRKTLLGKIQRYIKAA